MSVFNAPDFDGHEQVVFGSDTASGLQAIIAIHSTALGPGVGGCRMYPYANESAAVSDALRLSRGMTYKSALAGLPFGGGKSVIVGDPRRDKSRSLLQAMARLVDSLGGRYVVAVDSGTTVADMHVMAECTEHVGGLDRGTASGGDPSPSTAYGVFLSISAAVSHRLGVSSLDGCSVAVQGLGNVGYELARLLVAAGATVFAADVNADNLQRAEQQLGVKPVAADAVHALEVDVFAPCALGAVLNADSIPQLRAGIVAGAANNQLATEADGAHLMDSGILYCPDFLINAGGIIDVYHRRIGGSVAVCRAQVERIGNTLLEVLRRADGSNRETRVIAEDLAREMIATAAATDSRLAKAV